MNLDKYVKWEENSTRYATLYKNSAPELIGILRLKLGLKKHTLAEVAERHDWPLTKEPYFTKIKDLIFYCADNMDPIIWEYFTDDDPEKTKHWSFSYFQTKEILAKQEQKK